MRLRFSLLAALVLTGIYVQPCSAANPTVIGSVAIDTPVIQSPDRLTDRSPEAHYSLLFPKVIGQLGLTSSGDIQLRSGSPFYNENKVRVGCEYPVGSGFTPYLTWERRFSIDDNRVIAGIRYSFKG